jgi:hypothetical protein
MIRTSPRGMSMASATLRRMVWGAWVQEQITISRPSM